MRIGELLIEQRKLRPGDLQRALADKPGERRLVSFLIAKGLVDFDDASRALGEQKGVACALAKHLAGRDPALAKLIPAELGRGSCVLPIGRSSKGAVIVCVRDPSPAVLASIKQAIRDDVLMVVAPAARLEHLVAEAYGKAGEDDFDIDVDGGLDLDATPTPAPVSRGPMPTPPQPFQRIEPPRTYARPETPAPLPPMPDMDALDPESIRLSLTDLDDDRVEKDPTQSGQIPIIGPGGTYPPANKPITTPPSIGAKATNPNVASPLAGLTRPEPTPPPSPAFGGDEPAPEFELELPDATPTFAPDLGPAGSIHSRPTKPDVAVAAAAIHSKPTKPDLAATANALQSMPDATPLPARAPRPAESSYSIHTRPKQEIKTAVSAVADAALRRPPRASTEPKTTRPMSLEAMQIGLDHAPTREAATDLVLSYIATRWAAGIVLAIRDRAAIGYRGHAVTSPESVTVSLGSPSTVQRAVQTRYVSVEVPTGVGQSALAHALNSPSAPAAAPVIVKGQPVAVIAVGDPIEGAHARDFAAADLATLAEALGTAYNRIMSR